MIIVSGNHGVGAASGGIAPVAKLTAAAEIIRSARASIIVKRAAASSRSADKRSTTVARPWPIGLKIRTVR